MLKNYISLLLLLFTLPVFAQVTKITGKVYDNDTKEPLPFVSVVFKNSGVGTTTDFDGNYFISTSSPTDSLIAAYVGYIKVSKLITKGKTQQIDFYINANTINLKEVVIKPGENPAHRILRLVEKNKPNNDNRKLDAFEYEVYNKIEFDINNIGKGLKKSRVMKPFDFVFDNIDSTNKNEKPYLPFFISETISEVYYRDKPKFKREVIKASKIAGMENKSVSQVMGDMYQNINIYDNNIIVFGKSFASPISNNGIGYYKYYLLDSLMVDGNYCYHIQFKPRRKQELTFAGNMWISDTTFAVKRLEMSIADDANLNFVNTLNVIQEYQYVDSTWMRSKEKLVIDFALQKKTTGFYGRKTTSYNNFKINKPKTETFYANKAENIIVEDDADKKDNAFWASARHDSLSQNETMIYKMVDTIQTLKPYQNYVSVIQMLASGYKPWGYFEIGPVTSIYSYNRIEEHRFKFGGRTSNKFSKRIELNGYSAYGTNDNKFKYSAGFRWMLQKKPTRQMLWFNYKHDYEVLGQGQNVIRQDNILSSLFRRNPLSNLTEIEQYKMYYDKEWFKGFNSRINLQHKVITPLSNFYKHYNADSTSYSIANIKTSEIGFYTRFALDEKFLEGEFDRVSLGTRSPVFQFEYIAGIKGILKSNYNYHKFKLRMDDRLRIGPMGYFDYTLEGGKIYGSIPYPLMEVHSGNETYGYDINAFNMMNFLEFVSDEYVSGSITHHFEGFFLNHLPLMRRLKWREVVSAKAIIGNANLSNRDNIVFPPNLYTLSFTKPYAEAGVGVENILKIIRVDALWRLSYLDHANIAKFGIRVSLQFTF